MLKFWQENKVFEKSLEARKDAPTFVFYDGPPFATGLPHYGHLLQSYVKDTIPRYQTMRGKLVERRWGWDCHGLPIENLVEQELKLEHKKDIEAFGIDKFNKEAEKSVLRYVKEWREVIERIGRWVDMEHDYKTMDWSYTESVWWIFKTLHEKKLISEGYKAMHLCPRCETTLANFEVGLGYKDITDISVTVKFELVDEAEGGPSFATATEGKPRTYVLAWTTTPWTLPGNVALAINPKLTYVKITHKKADARDLEYFVLAKDRLVNIEGEYEIVEEVSGEKLAGKPYKPLFDYYSSDDSLKNRENGWKIYAADFVTTEDGTGVVHIAPAFGEDDMNLGKKENFPFIQHVSVDGKFKPEVADFVGADVKPKGDHQATDIEIIKFLAKRDLIFSKKKIIHSYPHCWRCETPLLNYAATSWFVNVTKIKQDLLRTNQEISWVPEHIKEGRFGKGLETAPDWAISRTRFWGAPLPVWRCPDCKEIVSAGKLEDLEARRVRKPNEYYIVRHGERGDLPVGGHPASPGESILNGEVNAPIHVTERGKEDIARVASELSKIGKFDFILPNCWLSLWDIIDWI